jgi:hypothetical protein
MRGKRRMTAVEYASLQPLLNISGERREAARQALVEGRTWRVVANQYGWSAQAVGDTVNVVWKTLEAFREAQRAASVSVLLPAGWEQVTLIAPSCLVEKFRTELAALSPTGTTAPENSGGEPEKKKARRGKAPGKAKETRI